MFPNASGLDLAATRRVFEQHLPGSIVYPMMNHNAYLAGVNDCDVSFSLFPFSGLHSVVDSLRQGIPVIALEGNDLHGRTDAMFLRQLELPEWLIAKDPEAYIAPALRLISNDKERVEISQKLIELDLDHVLFGDATTLPRSEVVEAMWWIYQNHEQIKASGRKVFRQEDFMQAATPDH